MEGKRGDAGENTLELAAEPMLEGSAAMFSKAFAGRWRPVYRSLGYRIALLVSALFMVLMPLLYVAAIGGIGWLVYWHFTQDTGMLTTRHGSRAAIFMLFAYLTPGILGAVLVLFLLKPLLLLFVGSEDENAIEVFAAEEPRLFGFVGAVCEVMRAPAPERIFIDCTPNAAAQLLGGGFAIFRRGKLGLHIGLPLVAGLDASGFAGVLAHEFGHFSQGAGMRATVIFSKITRWIGLAAYQRDGLDDGIAGMQQSQEGYAAILGLLLALCIGVARLVLKVVFLAGYVLSQIMGRRMEFDADRHQARFVGSKAAIATWPKMLALTVAAGEAEAKVAEQWHNRTLPEDLPALIAAFARRQSPDVKASIRKELEDSSTGWFDTHPATGVRIRHMAALEEPGVFRLDEPATSLFTNFEAASKRASYNHYKARVGEFIFSATFVPAAKIFGSQEAESARIEAAQDFLGFDAPDWRPLTIGLNELMPAEDPKKTWEAVARARSALAASGNGVAKAVEEYLEADRTLVQAAAAPAAFAIGVTKLRKDFRYAFATSHAMHTVKDRATDTISNAAATIDDALDAARARVTGNLRLLATKGIEKRVARAPEMRERAGVLLPAHAALREALPVMRQFREDFQKAMLLAAYTGDAGMRDKARESIRPLSDVLRDRILSLRQDWGALRSPYPGVDGETSLGGFVVTAAPPWREYDQIFAASSDLLERYTSTQRRIVAELVEIAAKTEAALGAGASRQQAAGTR